MEPTRDCLIGDTLDIFYALGVPRGKMTKKAKKEAVKRIREELRELQEAIDNNDHVEELDACADLIVVVCDYAYRNNYPLEEGLAMVNFSNASKILVGDELDNTEDDFAHLEAKGKRGLQVLRVDYEGFESAIPTGCIVDETGKFQKPLKFVEPMLEQLFVTPSEEDK